MVFASSLATDPREAVDRGLRVAFRQVAEPHPLAAAGVRIEIVGDSDTSPPAERNVAVVVGGVAVFAPGHQSPRGRCRGLARPGEGARYPTAGLALLAALHCFRNPGYPSGP